MCLFFPYLLEFLLLLLDEKLMKKANNFQIAKMQPQGITTLIFA